MVKVRGTGSADPQQMLIFWVLLIFCTAYVGFILKHLLFVHATEYGVNKQQVFEDETYIGRAEYEKSTEYYHLLRVSGTCPSDPSPLTK